MCVTAALHGLIPITSVRTCEQSSFRDQFAGFLIMLIPLQDRNPQQPSLDIVWAQFQDLLHELFTFEPISLQIMELSLWKQVRSVLLAVI